MDGYDPTAMPYLGNPLSFNHPVTNDPYLNILPTPGLTDQRYPQPGYSTDDFGGNNNNIPHNNLPNLPLSVPSETGREFSTGYEDFHFDNIPQEAQEAQEQLAPEPNTSIDRDDELLSFNLPTYNFNLLDYSLHRTSVSLNARLHGMFFMADPPTTPVLYPQMTIPELTCYRRNLFQVTGSITLPRNLRYILTDNGDRIPIVAQELSVSATESVEGHPVKLISVPWKTPVNNVPAVSEDKTEKEPSTIPLDTMSNQDMDSDYATFPIAWKRLQFRIATANNGRRKELQQHFVARLKLIATLSNGTKVSIAEAKSAAIVVRGRSPRNFQQRKDLAVGGDKSTIRKSPNSPAIPTRRATADTAATRSPLKRERSGENSFAAFSFNVNEPPGSGSNAFNSSGWNRSTPGSSSAPALPTPTFRTPTLPSSKSTSSASPPSLPQSLSLTDDYDSKRGSAQRPSKLPRKNSSSNRPHPYKNPSLPSLPSPKTLLSSHPQKAKSEGTDSADALYEYIPLAMDDWQPPVDAVYRPHVVHHITMAAGAAAGRPSIGGRSKRYFSEDVS